MKKCRGFFIPHHRTTKHTSKNPFYLCPEGDRMGSVNTTDEFITISVYTENGSSCADCKQSNCKDVENETTYS